LIFRSIPGPAEYREMKVPEVVGSGMAMINTEHVSRWRWHKVHLSRHCAGDLI